MMTRWSVSLKICQIWLRKSKSSISITAGRYSMIKNSVSLFFFTTVNSKAFRCRSASSGELEYKILKNQMQKSKACGCRYASSRQDEYKKKSAQRPRPDAQSASSQRDEYSDQRATDAGVHLVVQVTKK